MLSVVWKLDRLGRDLRHLINTVHDLTARGTGLKVLTGHGATIDTTTAAGKLVFGIFAALAEFERELIAERTTAGLASARARGRNGGRPYRGQFGYRKLLYVKLIFYHFWFFWKRNILDVKTVMRGH